MDTVKNFIKGNTMKLKSLQQLKELLPSEKKNPFICPYTKIDVRTLKIVKF